MNTDFGLVCETHVAHYLETIKHWNVLERRVWFREGEIDLIAEAPEGLYFVEVKGRKSVQFGSVVESVTAQKVRRLKRAVLRWRQRSGDSRPGQLWFVGVWMQRDGSFTLEEHCLE